jgi:hypothetical protein
MKHACNPSCSGGTNQEDRGSKPAQAKSSARPYLEKPFTKIGLVEWLKVKALSSSPSTTKKKERKKLTKYYREKLKIKRNLRNIPCSQVKSQNTIKKEVNSL